MKNTQYEKKQKDPVGHTSEHERLQKIMQAAAHTKAADCKHCSKQFRWNTETKTICPLDLKASPVNLIDPLDIDHV